MAYSQFDMKFVDRTRKDENIVREYIKSRRLTQKEFAAEVQSSIGAVSQWLSGKRKIPGPVKAYILKSQG